MTAVLQPQGKSSRRREEGGGGGWKGENWLRYL